MSANKMRNYVVIWQPLQFPCTVDLMRVIDAFQSTETLAQVRDRVEGAAALGEYSWQQGEGIITVVEKPDTNYRVLAPRRKAMKHPAQFRMLIAPMQTATNGTGSRSRKNVDFSNRSPTVHAPRLD